MNGKNDQAGNNVENQLIEEETQRRLNLLENRMIELQNENWAMKQKINFVAQ